MFFLFAIICFPLIIIWSLRGFPLSTLLYLAALTGSALDGSVDTAVMNILSNYRCCVHFIAWRACRRINTMFYSVSQCHPQFSHHPQYADSRHTTDK